LHCQIWNNISNMENAKEELEESYKVPNLEKGIAVLELLSEHSLGMTLQEIKSQLDISQTTAYRILNTLVRLGYLNYNEAARKYRSSRKMLTVGFRSIQEHNLLQIVLPKLRELRDVVKETVCFGVMGPDKALFIEQAIGSHPFCFVLTPGKEIELHCSAPGKAMMAHFPDNVRDSYLSKMGYERHNARTIINEADYLKELEKVKKTGIAFDKEEELGGVICIGSAILNYDAFPCGSIWISGPKDRLPEKTIAFIASAILECTQTISFELGYNNDSVKR
jgi:DNA-binding IclR family transcriptional regulator